MADDTRALPKPMFSTEDLKDKSLADRLVERVKASLSGFVPDEYWEPMVAEALNDLYTFKVVVRPYHYTVTHRHSVRDGDAQPSTIEVLTLEEWLGYKVGDVVETRPYTFSQYDSTARESHDVEDTVEVKVIELRPSKFYEIVRAESIRQGELLLIAEVQKYFTLAQEADPVSGFMHSTGRPTDLMRDAVREAMPQLLEGFFSDLVSRRMHDFKIAVEMAMRNGHRPYG